jgi:hypothetical protein
MKDKIKHEEALSLTIGENARLGAELKRTQELLKIISGEHDAAIRQDEREEVLDNVVEILLMDMGLEQFRNPEYDIVNDAIRKMQSLRQPKKKKEGAP